MTNILNCPLLEASRKYPDSPALQSENKTINYSELNQQVLLVASKLLEIGIKKNDHVAIVAETCFEYPIILFALWRIGAIACPINPKFPTKLIKQLLKDIDTNHLITNKSVLLENSLHDCNHLTLDSLLSDLTDDKNNTTIDIISLDQPATIIFTSGTTSHPKAAVHSFGNHYYNALGSNENIAVSAGDIWLMSLPLYHVGGIAILFRVFLSGGSVFIPDKKNDLAELINNFKITHLSLVSTQLFRLIEQNTNIKNIKYLKAILLGGSQIPDDLIDSAINKNLPVYKSYGLTEMSSQVTTTKKLNKTVNHCGKILHHRDLKISEKNEILVKGKTLFKGYYKDKQIIPSTDKDGWFHTGDIGWLDNQNNLIVTGRIDNMFISGGENIHPEEIEREIQKITNCSYVIVVDIDDVEFGKRLIAFTDSDIDQDLLINKLKLTMPSYKIPIAFYKWQHDPSQIGMKINRKFYKQLAVDLFM